ncbi:MAG: ABC transporter ATP-binding protein [Clostridia bacterium]|nr:ABC transporter ATP-binding protein [Clostridia bacterium]
MDTILSIEHVSNYYYDNGLGIFARRKKKQVLHDVSLTIGKDEFFGLVGESGCGKTTLGNCILGNIPFEGRITLGGMERKDADRLTFTRMVQSVYQDPSSALNPRRTVGQTMMEPLLAHGIGTPESRSSAVDRMLYRIGLDPTYKNRKPSELSGGQRQRVCIGAALMLEPELIIADEAVSALDVSVGSQILNLFLEIDVEKDFSMLFISHNLSVVYYLCDRIGVMYKGRIVELGTAEDVYFRPAHPYTKLLLSAVPEIEEDSGRIHLAQEDYESLYRTRDSWTLPGQDLINIAEEGAPEHLVLGRF